ncbi:L-seryl-tRNA(Sec) selenium transferase [Alteribacter populi]|uniref:L-seryl-tRNA(Sec) selenium transferase n=1 Tax=Alteribacter populi TaxID=2011011 RepID=UPI001E3DB1F9|nr:L-seryl-tRNA(Sec) selenium transferase [Alteribacter populi]
MNLQLLPPVHALQNDKMTRHWIQNDGIPETELVKWFKEELASVRQDISDSPHLFSRREHIIDHILTQTEKRVKNFRTFRLYKVLNGTGTVLHTNLGRARLSESAIERVAETSRHYSNLEYQTDEGIRGSRHSILQHLLRELTGAEDAMVVNNNAAAVYLILRGLAKNKEVIISRGELVEIGGSFRISTIMEESDALLREVGTTNKTHAFDYEEAISEKTAMIMKVHTSNFKTVGFTADVETKSLSQLTSAYDNVLIYEDLGSGSLYPFTHEGIGEEPVVKEAIKNGADIVSFSGDKLLGGPQAGIISGRKEIINRLKKHPLARVLRVDKMTLAALEQTLQMYIHGDPTDIPTVRDIKMSQEEVEKKAALFMGETSGWPLHCELVNVESQVGGGTMPVVKLPSKAVKFKSGTFTAGEFSHALRQTKIPVIGRVIEDHFHLDFRTITYDEIPELLTQCKEALTILNAEEAISKNGH